MLLKQKGRIARQSQTKDMISKEISSNHREKNLPALAAETFSSVELGCSGTKIRIITVKKTSKLFQRYTCQLSNRLI